MNSTTSPSSTPRLSVSATLGCLLGLCAILYFVLIATTPPSPHAPQKLSIADQAALSLQKLRKGESITREEYVTLDFDGINGPSILKAALARMNVTEAERQEMSRSSYWTQHMQFKIVRPKPTVEHRYE